MLQGLVEHYVGNGKPLNNTDQVIVEGIYQQIESEMRTRLEGKIREEVKKELEKQLENERNLTQIKHLKNLMIESVLIAFIIGMIVNQGTEMIFVLKPNQGDANWWTVTIAIAAGLSLAVFLTLAIRILNSVTALFENSGNK